MGDAVSAGIWYSKEHEWVKVEGDTGTFGITDFAQRHLTEIVFVELPEAGRTLEAGKPVAVIESVKSVSDVFSPVSGEVIEVNDKLVDNPEVLNKDPSGEGWMIRIRMSDKKELDGLMTKEQYEDFIKEDDKK